MQKVFLNKYNYYELKEKPSSEELKKYYTEKYYQESKSQYKKSYDPAEIEFINNRLNRKFNIIKKYIPNSNAEKKFLDIGCGEGWALSFFAEWGWKVTGLDYSDAGCLNINPHVSQFFIKGNIYENLDLLIDRKEEFDAILLDNVLEHVLDPFELIIKLKNLVKPQGILTIELPNDFSFLQKYLMDTGKIDREFWIAVPDHISYFNMEGLCNLLEAAGWENIHFSTDFPIDINLLNEDTNYVKDKTKGKNVHLARVELENLLDSKPTDLVEQLYSTFAKLGMGRNLIGYFRLK